MNLRPACQPWRWHGTGFGLKRECWLPWSYTTKQILVVGWARNSPSHQDNIYPLMLKWQLHWHRFMSLSHLEVTFAHVSSSRRMLTNRPCLCNRWPGSDPLSSVRFLFSNECFDPSFSCRPSENASFMYIIVLASQSRKVLVKVSCLRCDLRLVDRHWLQGNMSEVLAEAWILTSSVHVAKPF